MKVIIFIFFVIAIISCSQVAMCYSSLSNEFWDACTAKGIDQDHCVNPYAGYYDKWKSVCELVWSLLTLWIGWHIIESIWTKIAGMVIVGCAWNQCADEVIYDPFLHSMWEVLGIPLMILMGALVLAFTYHKKYYERKRTL